jgi:predicted RNA-binding Zn-ribbon protein involved in translation (DUF1610 family)
MSRGLRTSTTWRDEYYLDAGWPDVVAVRCPHCGQQAAFESGVARKYLLNLVPVALERHLEARRQGTVRCPACGLDAAHRLTWPDDAFFQWRIRNSTLWAWSADHARVLLAYIGSLQRDPDQFPGYEVSLRQLPKAALAAHARDRVIKLIARTLAEEHPPAPNP